jgi:hypothetical protein
MPPELQHSTATQIMPPELGMKRVHKTNSSALVADAPTQTIFYYTSSQI